MLQEELGVDAAVVNTGDINAQGGKVLLTASVSKKYFSQAVNVGELNPAKSAVVNADGSLPSAQVRILLIKAQLL